MAKYLDFGFEKLVLMRLKLFLKAKYPFNGEQNRNTAYDNKNLGIYVP